MTQFLYLEPQSHDLYKILVHSHKQEHKKIKQPSLQDHKTMPMNRQFHKLFLALFLLLSVCQGSEQNEQALSSLYSSLFNNADVLLPNPPNIADEIYNNEDSLVASLQKFRSHNFGRSLKALNASGVKFKTSTSECLRDLTIIFNDIHPKSDVCMKFQQFHLFLMINFLFFFN